MTDQKTTARSESSRVLETNVILGYELLSIRINKRYRIEMKLSARQYREKPHEIS